MSPGSLAELIPFKRFLDCRQRRHRIAAATGTAVIPASTESQIEPEMTGTANADLGALPRGITDCPRNVCRVTNTRSLGGVNGSATGAARDRSSADAGVFRAAPSR